MLTKKQKDFITKRNLRVGDVIVLPRYGFVAYSDERLSTPTYMDTNPFTKSLDHEPVEVLEVNQTTIKVGWTKGEVGTFYLSSYALENRDLFLIVLGFIFIAPFFHLKNWWTK